VTGIFVTHYKAETPKIQIQNTIPDLRKFQINFENLDLRLVGNRKWVTSQNANLIFSYPNLIFRSLKVYLATNI
jgi:hypothetical protein